MPTFGGELIMIESLIPSDYEEVEMYMEDVEPTYAGVVMSCCVYSHYAFELYHSFYFRGIAGDGTVLVGKFTIDSYYQDSAEVDLTSCSLKKLIDRFGHPRGYEIARKKECPPLEEN